MRWALLLMDHSPEVQQRVREEIHEKIGGKDRQPRFSDRSVLRYTEAVLLEVQRFFQLFQPVFLIARLLPVKFAILKFLRMHFLSLTCMRFITTLAYGLRPTASIRRLTSFVATKRETSSWLTLSSSFRLALESGSASASRWRSRSSGFLFVGILQNFSIKAHPEYPLPNLQELSSEGLVREPLQYRLMFDK